MDSWVGLQSYYGQFGEEKKLLLLAGIKPRSFEAIGHSLATILAELSQLLGKCVMMTTARLLPTCAEKQSICVAYYLTWPKGQIVICHQAGVLRDENLGRGSNKAEKF